MYFQVKINREKLSLRFVLIEIYQHGKLRVFLRTHWMAQRLGEEGKSLSSTASGICSCMRVEDCVMEGCMDGWRKKVSHKVSKWDFPLPEKPSFSSPSYSFSQSIIKLNPLSLFLLTVSFPFLSKILNVYSVPCTFKGLSLSLIKKHVILNSC